MTKRNKKRVLSLAIGLVLAGVSYYLNQQQPPATVLGTVAPGYYRVVEFADGDTIAIDMAGKTERVRLIGVDTPETHDPRKAVQCFGKAASEFTKKLIGNEPVRLESDPQSQNRDRYDRLLRYVYLPSGKLVQEELIREGYGFAYTSFSFTKSDLFKALETQAKDQHRGLWSACELIPNEFGGFTPAAE